MKTLKIILLVLFLFIKNIKSENLSLGATCQAHDGSEGSCVAINDCSSIEEKLKNHQVKIVDVVCNQFLRYVCCPSENTLLTSRCKNIFIGIFVFLFNKIIVKKISASIWDLIGVRI